MNMNLFAAYENIESICDHGVALIVPLPFKCSWQTVGQLGGQKKFRTR